jgi:hypothetical protein
MQGTACHGNPVHCDVATQAMDPPAPLAIQEQQHGIGRWPSLKMALRIVPPMRLGPAPDPPESKVSCPAEPLGDIFADN